MESGAPGRKTGTILLFSGLVLAYFISFFYRVSASVVMPILSTEWGLSATVTGVISSLYFYSYAAMQPLSGALNDRFGPVMITSIGLVVAAVGSVVFGYSGSAPLLGVGRLLTGLGLAPMLSGALVFGGANFDRRRYATISGITFFIGNLGAITAVSPLGFALDTWGREDVFLSLALAALVLSALLLVGLRYLPAASGGKKEKGGSLSSIIRRISDSWRLIAKSKTLIAASLLWSVGLGPFLSLQGLWAVAWSGAVYADVGSARLWATLLGVGMMSGNLLGALLSPYDKVRLRLISGFVRAFGLTWIALCIAMALKWPFAVTSSIAFTLGLFTGGCLTLLSAAINDFSPSGWGGAVFGIANMGAFITSIIAQMLTGFIIDRLSGGAGRSPAAFATAIGLISLLPISAVFLLGWIQSGKAAASV